MASDISELLQTGLEHHQSGRLQEAESIYLSILKEQPQNPDALHLMGVMAHQVGKNEIAIDLFEKAIRANPNEPDFYNNSGEAFRALKKYDQAIACYKQALEINPGFAGAYNNFGNVLKEMGKLEEAIERYQQAIVVAPDFPIPYNNLGIVLKDLGRHSEAISRYEQALSLLPDYAEAHSNLGNVLLELEREEDAIIHYQKALAIMPGYAEAHSNLGNALRSLGRQTEAIKHYEQAIALRPDFAMAQYNMGIALDELGRPEDAIGCYESAIAINADYAEAYNNLGFSLQELGRREEAIRNYKMALSLKPDYAAAHLHLSMLIPGQEQIPAIENLLSSPSLSETDATHYHFALGNIYNGNEMFDKAFEHFSQANQLKRKNLKYDAKTYSIYVDELIKSYTEEFLEKTANFGSDSNLPVFIIGMPRSGTTLVEQILSSHSEVYGAGELSAIRRIEKALAKKLGSLSSYPDCMSMCDEAIATQFSEEYLQEIISYSPNALGITDKNPGNFHRIGLIKTLFPNARIIHCRRNVLDTCTSIFFNHFVEGNEYSFDLKELGQYYLDYEKLMDHWLNLFPGDILTVQYEELVRNQEEVSRQLVQHIGLDWDDNCIDFHLNKRPVRTASSVQVRQPIYTRSIERWKHYEKQLAPLMEVLNYDASS
ncbi:MAG: tetratricopeptide repeat protein [Gammaproteobacteria bacterium]|jgi:tetratricopeptide (TPR) repeat protein|nr:tetratricopeptide repeat protein [Gammaproteobacteria bacterium]